LSILIISKYDCYVIAPLLYVTYSLERNIEQDLQYKFL